MLTEARASTVRFKYLYSGALDCWVSWSLMVENDHELPNHGMVEVF